MPKNSAAGGIYGGFTSSKIRRLIRRAVIFPADFRRTNFRRRIRRSAVAEGSIPVPSGLRDPTRTPENVYPTCTRLVG